MAFTTTKATTWLAKGIHRTTWTFTGTSAGSGAAHDPFMLPDKSIHVFGTFGGGTLTIQGSNQAASVSAFHTLNDANGNAMAFTTSVIEQVLENTRFIRPRVTTAGAALSLTAILLSRSELR